MTVVEFMTSAMIELQEVFLVARLRWSHMTGKRSQTKLSYVQIRLAHATEMLANATKQQSTVMHDIDLHTIPAFLKPEIVIFVVTS
jgi:hypothetical protein